MEFLKLYEKFETKIEHHKRYFRPRSVHIYIPKNGLNAVFKPFLLGASVHNGLMKI